MQKNVINKTLKSDSGASIIFVLCTLLFVMTIGVSVLVASSAAAGASIDSQTLAKAELYSDSLIKTVTSAIKGDLGKKIVISTANGGFTGENPAHPSDFDPLEWNEPKEITIAGLPQTSTYTVTAKILPPAESKSLVSSFSFTPEIPEIPEIAGTQESASVPGTPRVPSVLQMNIEAVVRTDVEYGDKRISVNSTYVCENIEIYDRAESTDNDDKYGEWRLVKIENTK